MAADKKFTSISVADEDIERIDIIRKRIMADWKKQHGIDMNLSIAGTIKLAVAYYDSRQTAGMTKGFDSQITPKVSS